MAPTVKGFRPYIGNVKASATISDVIDEHEHDNARLKYRITRYDEGAL
jgi:hypothetical protein